METLIGFIALTIFFDIFLGRALLMEGGDSVLYPVMWTWYSTYLMLVNIAKGVILAVVRILSMLVILVRQVCMRSGFVCATCACNV